MHHTPGAAVPDSGCPFFYKMFRYHTASVSLPVQAAAVCYRMGNGDVEFLLVRTSSGKWTFPKGCVEPGFSHRQIAAKEALEEAGVIGSVAATHLHVYLHPKGSCKKRSPQEFAVKAFLLQVKTLRDPQEVWRKPTWFTAREAKKALSLKREPRYADDLRAVIDSAVEEIRNNNGHHQSRSHTQLAATLRV